MRCKSKVLARFPDARLDVLRRYDDGTPRYCAVFSGARRLDINNPDDGSNQLPTQAWRSAYYWGVRNPLQRLALPVDAVPAGPGWRPNSNSATAGNCTQTNSVKSTAPVLTSRPCADV